MLLASGHTIAVGVVEAVPDVVEPDCVEVTDAVTEEPEPEVTSLAPQMLGDETAAPRVDFR